MDGSLVVSGLSLMVSAAALYRGFRNDSSVARPLKLEKVFIQAPEGIEAEQRAMAKVPIRSRSKVECKVDAVRLAYGTHRWCGIGRNKSMPVIDLDFITADQLEVPDMPDLGGSEEAPVVIPPDDTVDVYTDWASLQADISSKYPLGGDIYLRPIVQFKNQRKRRALLHTKVNLPSSPSP